MAVKAQEQIPAHYCDHPAFTVYKDALLKTNLKGDFMEGKIVNNTSFNVYGIKQPIEAAGGTVVTLMNFNTEVCANKEFRTIGTIYQFTIANAASLYVVGMKKPIEFPAGTQCFLNYNFIEHRNISLVTTAVLPAAGMDINGKHYVAGYIQFHTNGIMQ